MKGNCGECLSRWYCDINPDECDAWPDPVPQTNADHIRSMTDEELVEFVHACDLGFLPWCDKHCEYKGDDGCDKCISSWLKQPYKEDT